MGGWQVTTSETLGVQAKFTVTLVLFHPAAFGDGAALAVIVGAVFSIFNSVVAFEEFPALSVAVATICCALPSVLTTCCGGHTATPDKLSEQV
jgi:hypothetical protein